jgi:vitamin B12 transporter
MSYLIFLFLLSLPSLADTLDPIEVRASKESSEFSLGSYKKISTDDLETQVQPALAPLIEKIPGVVSNQNGGPGGRVSFFIRGTESRHVAFTLDSLRINDPSNTDRQFDSAFLTSSFIKELTVYKGPQAVLFGSDAFGGLVDMKSRKGEKAPQGRLSISGGSFGTISSSLSQDWRKDDHQGTVTVIKMRTDGISRLNKKRFNAQERDSADITQIISSSEHHWSKKWQTDFLVSYLRGKNELDGATDDNHHDKSQNDQYITQQKTTFKIDKQSAISLRDGFNRHQRNINTLATGKNSYAGNYIQHEGLYEFKQSDFSFLTGVAHEDESFNEWNFHLDSLFAQGLKKIGGFSFQGGARAENHSRYGRFLTGSLGASYAHKNQVWGLQYSQGFKAPSLYQLNALPLFGFPVGNKNLNPERNHSIEGNWKWLSEIFDGELSIYQNKLSNLITFTNAGYLNQGNFTIQGAELSGTVKTGRFAFTPGLNHQKFKNVETPILRRPVNTASLNVSFFPVETQELFLKMRAYSARKDLNPNGDRVKLNPYETLDLGWKLVQGQLDYGIQVVNVLDRGYEELYGYSVMPRSVFGNVGLKY